MTSKRDRPTPKNIQCKTRPPIISRMSRPSPPYAINQVVVIPGLIGGHGCQRTSNWAAPFFARGRRLASRKFGNDREYLWVIIDTLRLSSVIPKSYFFCSREVSQNDFNLSLMYLFSDEVMSSPPSNRRHVKFATSSSSSGSLHTNHIHPIQQP